MALYLIGIGLGNEQDITLNGINAVKRCSKVYLEAYTSRVAAFSLPAMEQLYGKKIILANRKAVEEQMSSLIEEAQKQDIALLIVGSPLAATTHIELMLEARKIHVPVHIIENASVLTAVAVTGLFLYKLGRVTTIPFENKGITTPYEAYLNNNKMGLHTLFLLDIQEDRMMTAQQGWEYLARCGLPKKTLVIGCAALGSSHPEICVTSSGKITLTKFPQCLIVPGELNFKEEEALTLYRT